MTLCRGKDCPPWLAVVWLAAVACCAGCGQTRSQLATEQMLASDAVDRSVSQLDMTPLAGKSVYFDTQYIRNVKGSGFVNADYIISSVRQQLFAYGCRLQDSRDDADVIVEGRVGVLGIDDHEITYGLPASNALNTAASAVTQASVPLPALPELSVAKKNEQVGAAKVALFAYDRETRTPLWQSGVATSMSDSDAFWVFGAGPFRRGTIYKGMQFAGTKVRMPFQRERKSPEDEERDQAREHALVSYQEEVDFGNSMSDRQKEERQSKVPEVEQDSASVDDAEPATASLSDAKKSADAEPKSARKSKSAKRIPK